MSISTLSRAGARRGLATTAAIAAVTLLAAGSLTACGGDSTSGGTATDGGEVDLTGQTVSVMGTWSGAEQDSFLAMVAPWEEKTGATVEYIGSRDLNAQITAGIASGNLPDIAGIPGPGQVHEWFGAGALQSLDFMDLEAYKASTPPGFAELGTVDGSLAGVFMSASVKGLIFTNTAVWTGDAPTTWDEMITTAEGLKTDAGEQLWCMGLESGAASGWPGTDWIENILLRQAGPDVYDRWSSLELEWTDQAIVDAFTTFNEVVANTFGGANAIVNTNFGRGGNGLFTDPAECVLFQQATFMTDFFQNEADATPDQFDFFRMPDINSEFQGGVMGGGNLVGMFNDTPAARSLMEWLVSADAQRIWVERGGFLAANTDVPLDAYVDDANRGSAEILQNAEVFRFDASDLMPGEMQDAFHSAMVNVVQNPDNLMSILESLEATRLDVVANQ